MTELTFATSSLLDGHSLAFLREFSINLIRGYQTVDNRNYENFEDI